MLTRTNRVMPVARKTGDAAGPGGSPMSLRDSSDDDEDETAELLRELEKIKKERAEKQAQEVLDPSKSPTWRASNRPNRTGKR